MTNEWRPDECTVEAIDDNQIDVVIKRWGYASRTVRLNWLLAQQLAADLQRVVEETKR